MTKLKISYQDNYEKIKHEFKSDADSTTIMWILEKCCKLLISLGFSLETIQSFVKFDGYEVYKFDDWDK